MYWCYAFPAPEAGATRNLIPRSACPRPGSARGTTFETMLDEHWHIAKYLWSVSIYSVACNHHTKVNMEFPSVDCTAKCYGVCDALVLFALRCRNLAKTTNPQWSNPLFTPKVAHSLRTQQGQMSTTITGGVRLSKTDVEEVSLVQLFSSIWLGMLCNACQPVSRYPVHCTRIGTLEM